MKDARYTRAAAQTLIPATPVARMMREATTARDKGEYGRAEQIYRDITERFPKFHGAWNCLGTLLYEQGRTQEALNSLQCAVRIVPEDYACQLDLAIALRNQKDYDGSLRAIEQAYAHASSPEDVLEQHARTLLAIQRGDELIEPLNRYFENYGENWLLRLLHGECLLQGGEPDRAREAFALAAAASPPGEPRAILRKASANLSRNHIESARKDYLTARTLFPKAADPRIGLANIASRKGQFTEAEKLARKALKLDSRAYGAWFLLAQMPRDHDAERALAEELEGIAATAGDDPRAWLLHFARGEVQERLGNYTGAFEAYALGNALVDGTLPASADTLHDHVNDIRSNLDSDFLERVATIGTADPGIIFICGMPRSGTTLVETILASHPRITEGGEMLYLYDRLKRDIGCDQRMPAGQWLASASDSTLKTFASEWAGFLAAKKGRFDYITDKMPPNFALLGFIHVCFPEARIVHVYRDPLDNCLSYFTTSFQEKNEFSYSLENVAHYYKHYADLMDHWRSILPPDRIIDVRYEDLVTRPEETINRLLASLGIEWDARCLDFHKSRRLVATASQFQIRKPLYTTSIGRWRHFERQLEPLVRALKEFSEDA